MSAEKLVQDEEFLRLPRMTRAATLSRYLGQHEPGWEGMTIAEQQSRLAGLLRSSEQVLTEAKGELSISIQEADRVENYIVVKPKDLRGIVERLRTGKARLLSARGPAASLRFLRPFAA